MVEVRASALGLRGHSAAVAVTGNGFSGASDNSTVIDIAVDAVGVAEVAGELAEQLGNGLAGSLSRWDFDLLSVNGQHDRLVTGSSVVVGGRKIEQTHDESGVDGCPLKDTRIW